MELHSICLYKRCWRDKMYKMLIADTDEKDKETIRQVFREHYEIIETSNREETLEKIRAMKNDISIVIIDSNIDGLTQNEISELRKKEEAFAEIPYIILTENVSERRQKDIYVGGANGYVSKPLVRETLEARVTNVLLATRKLAESQKKQESLREIAERDQMTGLYRKVTMEKIVSEVLKSEPNKLNAMLILDIDNFKYINDTEGHLLGDHAIRRVARILKENFRKADIIGRIGGDEFMVLLKDIPDKDVARRKAQDIVRVLKVRESTKMKSKTTVSVGLAFNDKNETDIKELFHKADCALYDAKRNGKACYCEYGVECKERDIKKDTALIYSKYRSIYHDIDNALEGKMKIVEVADRESIESAIEEINGNLDLMYIDISSHEDNGEKVLNKFNSYEALKKVPRLVICKEGNTNQYTMALEKGANDIITLPLEAESLKRRTTRLVKILP